MSLATPESIRKLQRKLYLKAKDEPAFRFYLLYDKISREDILRHAYDLARANRGAPGVDGITFAAIEAAGLEEWLGGLRKDVVAKTYRPEPVRRGDDPEARRRRTAARHPDDPGPGGADRRQARAGASIFEADLDPAAYGYRPGRSGADAIKEVHVLLCRGFTDVV